MAIKIKKRGEKSEEVVLDPLLDTPDQFLQTADTSLSWASQNQQKIIVGVGAAVVLVLVGVFMLNHFQQKSADRSAALTAALDVLVAPVGEETEVDAKKKGPRFVSEQDKYKSLGEKADVVLAEYGGTPAAELATIMKARASFGAGKFDEAAGLYKKWLDAHPTHSERAFVLQAMATAQAAAGKADEAVATLQSLKGLDAATFGELADVQAGQVYEAAGQKDKAKAAYEAVIKAYPDSSQLETVKMRLDLL